MRLKQTLVKYNQQPKIRLIEVVKKVAVLEALITIFADSKSALARKFGAGQGWNVGGRIKFS